MRSPGPARRHLLLAAVFYVNLLSLGCQLLWVRRFNVLFGSTVAVFGTVLATFLLGLALGGGFGGRRAEASAQPWRTLGAMLGLLGLYVTASLWIFDLVCSGYLALVPADLSPLTAALTKLPVVLLLVLPPTFLIGGMLPFAVALSSRAGEVGRTIASLYALDTLGAALGALVTGFLLVPGLGLRASSWLLGGVALALAVVIWRSPRDEPADAPRPIVKASAARKKGRTGRSAAEPATSFGPPTGWRAVATLAAFLFTGAAALLLETGWNRFFYLLNGTNIFSLAVVLTGFLAGIGLGSVLVRRRLERPRQLPLLIATLLLLVPLGGMLVFRSEELFSRLYLALFQDTQSYVAFQLLTGLLIAVIVCIATLAMGANFPAVSRLLAPSRERAGSSTGTAYLANTVGAVIGALLGELVILPRLGYAGLMATVTLVYVAAAAVFVAIGPRPPARRLVGLAALAAAAIALTPPLRPFEPPANAVYYSGVRRGSWPAFAALNASQQTVWRRQGFYGQVAVLRGEDGTLYLKHNGKTDASTAIADNFAQYVLGHLPMLLHGDVRSVLNIGLGGGTTLGAIVAHPSPRQVVQVEIDPLVAEAADTYFGSFNRRALEDPRVRLVIDDGRNYVQRPGPAFDVIVSEPPNIWVSGVSGLFTEQFYRAARARLAPGGLLCQWLPLYELAPEDFATALRTIGTAFPHVAVWTNGAVAAVIAGERPLAPLGALPALPAPVRDDLERAGIPEANLLAYLAHPDLGPARVASWQRRGRFVNRDDRPLLEFHTARNLFLQLKQRDAARWRAALVARR